MGAPDPRLAVNATVHAKAIYIKNYAECARLYGSAASTKMVEGRVTSFSQVKNAGGRRVTTVTALWHMSSAPMPNSQVDK